MAELAEVKDFKPSISAGLTVTKNLGNFESVKVSITITDQQRGEESVKQATDRIYRFVESEVDGRLGEYGN